ncbi:MAG TPA: hypothetical protein VFK09_11495 [Gemmatimonadales bacterium]|jgi:hypothetical protein|nr:hypothetical protein [Gemmatimonadales bacterium]
MFSAGRWLRSALPGALLVLGAGRAAAQAGVVSTAKVITLAAIKQTKLSLAVTSGAIQSLPALLDNQVNNFATPVMLQTQWDLNPGQTGNVTVVGWFGTPAQALVSPGPPLTAIASSRMQGKVTPGAAAASWPATFTAFTQNATAGLGSAGGSLLLLRVNVTGANKTTTRTDQLDLQLDLTGVSLPVGTYSGTLNIQAVTQ